MPGDSRAVAYPVVTMAFLPCAFGHWSCAVLGACRWCSSAVRFVQECWVGLDLRAAAGPAPPPPTAAAIGTANPIPANESSSPGSAMDTTMPTTRPLESSSGPPELPGLTAASNWISPRTAGVGLGGSVEAGDDPAGRGVDSPAGCRSRPRPSRPPRRRPAPPEPPPRAGCRASAWPCRWSGWPRRPSAADLVPSENMIVTLPPSEMTWLAVRMVPVSVTMTPDPTEPFDVSISTTDGATWL